MCVGDSVPDICICIAVDATTRLCFRVQCRTALLTAPLLQDSTIYAMVGGFALSASIHLVIKKIVPAFIS